MEPAQVSKVDRTPANRQPGAFTRARRRPWPPPGRSRRPLGRRDHRGRRPRRTRRATAASGRPRRSPSGYHPDPASTGRPAHGGRAGRSRSPAHAPAGAGRRPWRRRGWSGCGSAGAHPSVPTSTHEEASPRRCPSRPPGPAPRAPAARGGRARRACRRAHPPSVTGARRAAAPCVHLDREDASGGLQDPHESPKARSRSWRRCCSRAVSSPNIRLYSVGCSTGLVRWSRDFTSAMRRCAVSSWRR